MTDQEWAKVLSDMNRNENEAWWRRGRLQPLTEAGYNRVQMHATLQPFIMLSAARGGLPRDEIRKRSRQLVQQIRSQGLGAIQVEGHWEEDTGPVVEPSFFVPLTGKTTIKNSDELLAFGQRLAAAYQQQTILFGDTKWVYEVGETVEVLGPVTDITTKEIGDIYYAIVISSSLDRQRPRSRKLSKNIASSDIESRLAMPARSEWRLSVCGQKAKPFKDWRSHT
jgi:hypothetical protein